MTVDLISSFTVSGMANLWGLPVSGTQAVVGALAILVVLSRS